MLHLVHPPMTGYDRRIPWGCWLAATAFLAVGTTCMERGAPVLYLDLVAEFDDAKVNIERPLIDLGVPLARAHTGAGWSDVDERWLAETTFVWGIGDSSMLALWIFSDNDVRLTWVGRPHLQPGSPIVKTITPKVNGISLQPIPVQPGWSEYVFSALAGLTRTGENHIEIQYNLEGKESHDNGLRMAWDLIRVRQARAVSRPRIDVSDGPPALMLPYWSEIAYQFPVSSASLLKIDRVVAYGVNADPRQATLLVALKTEAATFHELLELRFDSFDDQVEFSIPATGGGTELVLIAVGPDKAPPNDSGVQLIRPRITAPR